MGKCSYIKLYGPPIDRALTELERLARELPAISKGEITATMMSSGELIIGDFDFCFIWKEEPTENELRTLIFNIDENLKRLNCRYSIVTK